MSQQFTRGQKSPLSALTSGTDLYVGVHLVAPGMTWDISCFGLDPENKLSDDDYFIFYNQPKSPEEAIQKLGEQSGDTDSFRVILDRVPEKIGRLSFCAALDGAGTASQIQSGYLRLVAGGQEVMRYSFTGADFGSERAIMICDLYRKGVWRVGAIGQGFSGGLADLIRSFGGEVDDEPEASSPPPAPPAFAPPPAPPAAPLIPSQPAGPPAYSPAPGYPPAQPQPPGYPAGQPLAPAPLQPGYPAQPQPGQPMGTPAGYGPPGPVPAQGAPGPHVPVQHQPVQPGVLVSLQKYQETATTGRWTKQNSHLVKLTLGPEAYARRGSMVAYQGNVEFVYKGSGGLRAFFEGAMTGQGLKLMTCKGQGEVFLAEDAADVHIVDLQGHSLCINANNILAFDASLHTEVQRIESAGIPGGGMFHLLLSGHGTVVVMTKGTPLTLMCQGPTFADMNAVVAWTAGMRVSVSTQVRVSREIYAGASGESVALQFMGMQGHFVVVQPYEV